MVRDIDIRVEGLGKIYRIGSPPLAYKSVRESLSQASLRAFRRFFRGEAAADGEFIWALKDVSLSVSQGEVVGIIGPNGAGKSTLLKILSRITDPTDGYAEIRGRVGSLLEVGTGFHPELTGRENIYLNGAILGMKQAEIGQKFDEIVAFSGVEKFIDTPVKRYSSGMHVRLAFAVAAHLDPEILLVDEVLAVGDAAFQKKCLGKMSEVARGGRTVLFVSHNMAAVRNLCSSALLLDKGRLQSYGDVDDTIQAYLGNIHRSDGCGQTPLAERQDRSGSGRVRVVNFEAGSLNGRGNSLKTCSAADFILSYRASDDVDLVRLHVTISIMDAQGANVFMCSTGMYHCDFRDVSPSGKIVCKISNLPLIPGKYWVNLVLKDDQGVADHIEKAYYLEVIDDGTSGLLVIPSRRWGNIIVPHEWAWAPADDPIISGHRDDIG